MTAYVIFIRENEVTDAEAMSAYLQKVKAASAGSSMKRLSVYGELTTVGGPKADGIVLLEFPSLEEAKRWYFSPAYQEAAEFRRNAAEYRSFIFAGS